MDDDFRTLEEMVYVLGEKVGAAGRLAAARDTSTGTAVLTQLRWAHGDLESAILAAMNVMHLQGAAAEGAAGLLGFAWRGWDREERERFERLWFELRASNVGDPALRRTLRELLARPSS